MGARFQKKKLTLHSNSLMFKEKFKENPEGGTKCRLRIFSEGIKFKYINRYVQRKRTGILQEETMMSHAFCSLT